MLDQKGSKALEEYICALSGVVSKIVKVRSKIYLFSQEGKSGKDLSVKLPCH